MLQQDVLEKKLVSPGRSPLCKSINLRNISRNDVGRSRKGEGRDKLISEFQVFVSNCSNLKHNRN